MEAVGKFVATPIVYHGPGSVERLAEELRNLGAGRAGIITDPGIVASGVCERVEQAAGVQTCCFADVQPEPPLELVARCAGFLKENRCDAVIGLGGGSAIDTAKMAAAMTNNDGKVSDYFGVNILPKSGLPVIAIPTTAGTGSEVSPAAVFVDTRAQAKKGVRSDFLLPRSAILDAALTVSLPPHLTASTGIDALTHAIEGYTSTQATFMSDLMAEQAVSLIGAHLREAYSRGEDIAARHGMLMGSYLAGITLAIANVGAVHALAQTVGGKYKVSHGVANALFLPYVMSYNRIACRRKYAKVAALLGERVADLSLDEASQKAVDSVRRLTGEVRIPQKLRELDVPEQELSSLAERCLQTQGRLVVLNVRSADAEALRGILEGAY